MQERLIVGFDGSAASAAAVRWAAAEAQRRGAIVRAVACYLVPLATDYWGSVASSVLYDDELVRTATAEALDSAVRSVEKAHPEVKFEQEVVLGGARQVLTEQSHDGDLLVDGTAGAGGALSMMLGSVAHAVARTSACPVVFVPYPEQEQTFDHLVVGVDGSPASDAALEWALAEAELRRARLTVLHAWWYTYGGAPESTVARDLTRLDAALVLEPAMERARAATAAPVSGRLEENEAAPALVTESSTADLIVVGSRGRGAFRTVLFGSVAHAVSARSTCPVVVVREPSA
jgi:nucleotide-binding universal stress UspA family protein